jgi:hypothetical protein
MFCGEFSWKLEIAMPGLSLGKVSRSSVKGQMENVGKLRRKIDGMNEKTG